MRLRKGVTKTGQEKFTRGKHSLKVPKQQKITVTEQKYLCIGSWRKVRDPLQGTHG